MVNATQQNFYNEVAERLPSPALIFLNYGYAEPSEPSRWIMPADRRYKCHLNLVKRVMSDVELAGKTVLEVGSGRGGNCYYLSRYTRAQAIYGVDLCEANVRFCRTVHHLPNATFIRGDAEQLPFRSEAFDVVLNLESSHCYPHFERFLTEVHRVLKPQGVFCYADLWFLEFVDLDWKQRKKALDAAPFFRLSEEDISQPVLQALASNEGLAETVQAMASQTNSEFVDEVVQRLRLVWVTLAMHHFSYLSWKFRKF
jgi:ubiquinone/menaquinone biosynthesis C-methylase UbiE